MIINHDGYTCMSLDQVKEMLGPKRYKAFVKFMAGQTRPLIQKKDIKLPEQDEWVFLRDLDKFTHKDIEDRYAK